MPLVQENQKRGTGRVRSAVRNDRLCTLPYGGGQGEAGEDVRRGAEFLQGILEDDIADALTELSTNGLIKLYSDFGFLLKDSAIIYMENRLQNKVNLIFDIISKIVSMLH